MDINKKIEICRSIVNLPNDKFVVNITLKTGESWLLIDSVDVENPEKIHAHARVFEYTLNIHTRINQM